MPKIITHEDFIKSIYSSNTTILENYKGSNIRIKCKCNICETEFTALPSNLKRYNCCPKCNKPQKTEVEYKEKLFNKCGDSFTIIGKYINASTRIKIIHNKCGHVSEVLPIAFINNGCKCIKCSNRLKKTTEQFKQELYNLVGDEYTVISDYISANDKILIRHNKCNNEYSTTPNKFLKGYRCTKCRLSKGEDAIRLLLKNNNIKHISQKKFSGLVGLGGRNLSYDFYLPKYNLLIEYQGNFHDGSAALQTDKQLQRQQEHDRRKKQYAIDNNIKLLEIWYWDFDNIEDILNKELTESNCENPVAFSMQ